MPALELPAPSGQRFPTEGGSRGLIWDPRYLRPAPKLEGWTQRKEKARKRLYGMTPPVSSARL